MANTKSSGCGCKPDRQATAIQMQNKLVCINQEKCTTLKRLRYIAKIGVLPLDMMRGRMIFAKCKYRKTTTTRPVSGIPARDEDKSRLNQGRRIRAPRC